MVTWPNYIEGGRLVAQTSVSGDHVCGRSKPDRLKPVLLGACGRAAYCGIFRAGQKINVKADRNKNNPLPFLRELCALCVLCVELCGVRP
jgi:NAD-dependent dihydropyrimidine dehydrogenase PreA subunit